MKRSFKKQFIILTLLTILAIAFYMTIGIKWHNERLMNYQLTLRSTKVIVMILVAYTIGGASIVFQSVISNTIVTPCILGMNSLYTLLHTALVFMLGTSSIFVQNSNVAFILDLIIMGIVATAIYGWMFKKTKYNVLYVLLIGTVLTSFFGSIQSTLIRVMDPNDYDALLTTLVASFDSVNSEIIIAAIVILIAISIALWKDFQNLDIISLGRTQAINLGVDYDHTIRNLLLGVVLYISVATALVGPISFLGLIIANVARQILKTYKNSTLIIGATLVGTIGLIGGQLIVERVYSYAIPVSIFITVAGGLYFLYLLLTQKKGAM